LKENLVLRLRIKIHSWLLRDFDDCSTSFKEIPVSVQRNESVLQMVSQLIKENNIFVKTVFDEKSHRFREDIIVILNGRIVNPDRLSEVIPGENDEIIFLPFLAGG
jgi:hypothetical protein